MALPDPSPLRPARLQAYPAWLKNSETRINPAPKTTTMMAGKMKLPEIKMGSRGYP